MKEQTYWAIVDRKGKIETNGIHPLLYTNKTRANQDRLKDEGETVIKVKIVEVKK